MTEISVESLKQQILQISNPLNIITLRQESPSLYQKLKSLVCEGENVRLIISLILEDVYPNRYRKCPICGSEYKCTLAGNYPKSPRRLKRTCSSTCELTLRHKDESYSKNIGKKSVDTKNNIIIDGETMHTISARKAAETIKKRYSQEERSLQIKEGHHKTRMLKQAELKSRFNKVVFRYGLFRTLCRMYLLTYSARDLKTFYYFCKKKEEFIEQELADNDIHNMYLQYIVKDNIYYCDYCKKPFNRIIDITESKVVRTRSTYCSIDCRVAKCFPEDVRMRKSEFQKMKMAEESRRALHSAAGKLYWTINDAAAFWKNVREKMGPEGIAARTKKAIETKLQRGVISSFRKDLPEERELYRLYRNEVERLTKINRLLIEDYHIYSFGKNEYHVDHIYPISKGYLYGIPPDLISDVQNLQILWCSDNRSKSNQIIEVPTHIIDWIKCNKPELLEEMFSL